MRIASLKMSTCIDMDMNMDLHMRMTSRTSVSDDACLQANLPIATGAFNKDGTIFSYAVSYDWRAAVTRAAVTRAAVGPLFKGSARALKIGTPAPRPRARGTTPKDNTKGCRQRWNLPLPLPGRVARSTTTPGRTTCCCTRCRRARSNLATTRPRPSGRGGDLPPPAGRHTPPHSLALAQRVLDGMHKAEIGTVQ